MEMRKKFFPCFRIPPAEALVGFRDGDVGEAGDEIEHYREEKEHGEVVSYDDEARDDGNKCGDNEKSRLHERELPSAVLDACKLCKVNVIRNPVEKSIDKEYEYREGDKEPCGLFGNKDEDAEMKRACENACAKGIPEP